MEMSLLLVWALWLTFPQQGFVTASGIVTPLGLSSCFTEVRRAFVQAPHPLFRVQVLAQAPLPWITNWNLLLIWDEVSHPKDEGISKSAKLFWVPTTPTSHIHSLWSSDELLQCFKKLSAWSFNCVSVCQSFLPWGIINRMEVTHPDACRTGP